MDAFGELNERLKRGDITSASDAELKNYLLILCRPDAASRLAGAQFGQACETVRMLLTLRHLDAMEKRNAVLQWVVIGLAVAAIVAAVAQIALQCGAACAR